MRVAVVSAGRSDRGLLDVLMDKMRERSIDVTLIGVGEKQSGCDFYIPTTVIDDSDYGVAISDAGVHAVLPVVLYNTSPDVMVVLGDRSAGRRVHAVFEQQ